MKIVFLLLFCFALHAEEGGIQVNLKSPSYKDGVLSTDKGGVIKAPRFRLQAEKIRYTKTKEEHFVTAECYVMLDVDDYIFVGDSLEYNFLTGFGVIKNGRTSEAPWFFGGETIDLMDDGSYVIHNAFITTSENSVQEWRLTAETVYLTKNRTLDVKGVKFQFIKLPVKLPSFKVNLCSLTEAPIRFYARWGGKQGARIGFKYDLFTLGRLKTYLRFDWRFKRGPGGGFETYYCSPDGKQSLETINFIAADNSSINVHQKVRYRFQGVYNNSIYNDNVTVRASWDKLSDIDMASDYNDRGLELDTAGRTELLVRRQDDLWITNFRSRVRVNTFQTLKQELPSLLFTQKSYKIGRSGLIFDNSLEASYLDFVYSTDQRHTPNYNSTRLEHVFRIYRPWQSRYFNVTFETGATSMYYGRTYHEGNKFLAIGLVGLTASTNFYQTCQNYKQTFTPYVSWQYLTTPMLNPNAHYIFDIDDGLWRVNSVKLGLKENLIYRFSPCEIQRLIETDLYTFLFVDSRPPAKVFADITFYTMPTIKQVLHTGWDLRHKTLDHFNLRNQWTLSRDMAISAEWRHRSRFSWRKAVFDNWILESFRTTQELLHSSVSDRRDTLLLNFFWRFHPRLAISFESRMGWNRRHQPYYREFEVDVIGTTLSRWNVKFSYQLKEDDHRIAIYLSLDSLMPTSDCSCLTLPLRF